MKRAKVHSFPVFLLLTCLFLSEAKVHSDHGSSCVISDEMEQPECPGNLDGFPVYFPFPNDCGQYLACENDTVSCFHCPRGRIWDQENKICNSPNKTNCTIVTIPVSKIKRKTGTVISAKRPQKLTTQDPVDEVCPEGFDGYIRYPADCRYYYNCMPDQQPCLYKCPDELYFNPTTGYCDYPWNIIDCFPIDPPPSSTSPRIYESEPHGILQRINLFRHRQVFEHYTKKIYMVDPCKIVLCCEAVMLNFNNIT